MQNAWRCFRNPRVAAKRMKMLAQSFGADTVGALGKADKNRLGRDENIAAIRMFALRQFLHAAEMAFQRIAHVLAFAPAGRRTGTQKNRSLRNDERRVLDENGIGKGFEGWQFIDLKPRALQRGDIGLM